MHDERLKWVGLHYLTAMGADNHLTVDVSESDGETDEENSDDELNPNYGVLA